MATHSSVLAWRIPGMGEPGGLPSMGLHRVGHDWSDLTAAAAAAANTGTDFIFLGSKITVDGDCSHEIKRCLLLRRKGMTNLDSVIKKLCFADKGLYSQTYGFSSSHVWMWELDHKEGWALKNWCFRIMVLEKTLESPLDCKEIKPVNPKGNQSWIFIGRTDAEAETPILWTPDTKSQLVGKDLDAGKDWRQKEKRVSEDQMVR